MLGPQPLHTPVVKLKLLARRVERSDLVAGSGDKLSVTSLPTAEFMLRGLGGSAGTLKSECPIASRPSHLLYRQSVQIALQAWIKVGQFA